MVRLAGRTAWRVADGTYAGEDPAAAAKGDGGE
jgi:hypothetical protein